MFCFNKNPKYFASSETQIFEFLNSIKIELSFMGVSTISVAELLILKILVMVIFKLVVGTAT